MYRSQYQAQKENHSIPNIFNFYQTRMEMKSYQPQQHYQMSSHKKIFFICVSAVLLTILCSCLIDDNTQNKNQQSSQKKYLSTKSINFLSDIPSNNSTFDKEWDEQSRKYNFTCVHGSISKSFEPSIINKPSGLTQFNDDNYYEQDDSGQEDQYDGENENDQENDEDGKGTNEQNISEEGEVIPLVLQNTDMAKKQQNEKQKSKSKQKGEQVFDDRVSNEDLSKQTFEENSSKDDQDPPIKISLDYSNFEVSQNNREKLNYIQQKLMPQMINTLRKIISVKKQTQSTYHIADPNHNYKDDEKGSNKLNQKDKSLFKNEMQGQEKDQKLRHSSRQYFTNAEESVNNQLNDSNEQATKSKSNERQQTSYKKVLSHKSQKQYKNEILRKKIIIPYGECFKTKVPQLHSSVGIDSDLILYITNTKVVQPNVLMWGVVCVRDYQDKYRPVAAQFNIQDDLLDPENDTFNVNALIHEITHILGFSRSSLALSTKQNNFIRKSISDPTKSILALDILKNYAQTYYNCTQDKLFQGIEIEDEESDPDQLSLHFEKRYLMNDIMTSDISANSMFSPLTLKVLESTGWYTVKQDISIPYQYLLCSGCSVLTNFTSYYLNQTKPQGIPSNPLPPPSPIPHPKNVTKQNIHDLRLNQMNEKNNIKHLTDLQEKVKKTLVHTTKFDSDLKKGNNLLLNTTLPVYKQQTLNSYDNGVQNFCNQTQFNQTMRGCSYDFKYRSSCYKSAFSNGYSYLQPLESGSCTDQQFNKHSAISNITGEVFQNSSFCFISNLIQNSTYSNVTIDSTRCYFAVCDTKLKSINVSLFNQTISCTSDNQIIINPFGLFGQLNCPNIKNFCLAYDLRNYNPNKQYN